jgi:Rrf2 family cysteine metabolism transcriptional repressor
MKISTKGQYGLEALVDLAFHASDGPQSIKDISERCGFSEAYILQIFIALKKARIVKSIRGAQGGYMLAANPSEITAGAVLEALEGPLAPVACIIRDRKKSCRRFEKCVTRVLWQKMMDRLISIASSVTVADLVEAVRRSASQGMDYSI